MARFCHRHTNRACNRVPGASPARSRSASSTPIDEVCMGTATGAQLLVRMLKAEGVHHLFTLSGLHIAPIYAACVEEGIGIVDTRHEQAAAHAADATARLTRRPGPVFLEVPWDVLSNGVDESEYPLPVSYRTRARQPGDPAYVERAAQLLGSAARPVLIAGSSIHWDDAAMQLAAFAERLGAPVYLNGAGRGSLPADHPHFFSHTRKDALAEADVVVIAGTPLDFRLGYGAGIAEAAKLVQIDSDASEIGRNRAVDIGIVGDSRSVLDQLTAATSRRGRTGSWLRGLREREAEKAARQAAFERSDQVPIHHFRLAKELDAVARSAGDSMFVADGGNWVAIAAKVIALRKPGRWLDPGPLGCLGVGAPFAIASKLLYPDRPVFVIQGDGSFGFNGMDFETALRFRLPMVVVVGNDAAWGQIRLPQVQLFGPEKSPATQLAPTRYDKVVEALGGHGEHVTEPGRIRPALERAVASGTVACVNVILDPDAPAASGAQGYAI